MDPRSEQVTRLLPRPRGRSGTKNSIPTIIDTKSDVINHFWICLDVFQHGILPIPPECDLSIESLTMLSQKYLAAHALSEQYFKTINFEQPLDATLTFREWKAVAMEDLKLPSDQLEMYYYYYYRYLFRVIIYREIFWFCPILLIA